MAHGVLAEAAAAVLALRQELSGVGKCAVGLAIGVIDQAEEHLGRRVQLLFDRDAQALGMGLTVQTKARTTPVSTALPAATARSSSSVESITPLSFASPVASAAG